MAKLILYHCSPFKYDKPSIEKSKMYLDFGRGLYLTEYMEDALRILKHTHGYLYTYELEENDLKILEFNNDLDWMAYILKNRLSNDLDDYDAVYGKTASGKCAKMFRDLRHNNATYTPQEIFQECSKGNYKEQWCIKTYNGYNKLKLVDVEEIEFSK